jgi:hypothetical protein
MTLLLYRNTLTEGAGPLFPGGLPGIGEVLAAGRRARCWPRRPPRGGPAAGHPWVGGAAAGRRRGAAARPRLTFAPPGLVAAGLVLGFVAQGEKICVDATLQRSVDDDVRGRVFSVYDTVVNVAYVAALVAGALLLPASGRSVPALLLVGAVYALTAAGYARATRDGG